MKEVMEVKAGKRRKKQIWRGNHGEVAWGEAGSSHNGKERRKFHFKGSQERKESRIKQLLLTPLTENVVEVQCLLIFLTSISVCLSFMSVLQAA